MKLTVNMVLNQPKNICKSPPLVDTASKKICWKNWEKAEFDNSQSAVNPTGTAKPKMYNKGGLNTLFFSVKDRNNNPAKEKAVISNPLLCFVRKVSPANRPAQKTHFTLIFLFFSERFMYFRRK